MIRIETRVTVEVFPERAQRALDSETGGTNQLLQGLTQRLLVTSSNLIGRTYSGHHPERGKSLRESGSVEKRGKGYAVVFAHPMARLHHDGARAHTMPFKDPNNPVGARVYVRRGPGGYSFGPTRGPINHPGSPANPYLIEAARQLGLQASGGLLRGPNIQPIFRPPKGFFA